MFNREELVSAHPSGWHDQIHTPDERPLDELALLASTRYPFARWAAHIAPVLRVEPDYEAMEDQPDGWIYRVQENIDQMYDCLPLNAPVRTLCRLETHEGEGVFANGVGLAAMRNLPFGAPEDDPLLARFVKPSNRPGDERYNRLWFFGCHNMMQLEKWLAHANVQKLERAPLRVGVYEVSSQWCVEGEHQLVFQKHRARLVDTMSLPQSSARKMSGP